MSRLDDARANFEFMRTCAQRIGVPHAEHWQLVYDPSKAFPYRVVDTGVSPADPSHSIAFVLHTGDPRAECDVIGRIFRGLRELRDSGSTIDLLCPARRTPPPSPALRQ